MFWHVHDKLPADGFYTSHGSDKDACGTEYRHESGSLHECFSSQLYGWKIYIDMTKNLKCIHYRIEKSVLRTSDSLHINFLANILNNNNTVN